MKKIHSQALDQLALDLNRIYRARVATQNAIFQATGISQSTISKAKRRLLKRETADTRALQKYANILLRKRSLPKPVEDAVEGFLSAGGSEADLVNLLMTATRLVRGRGAA